MTTAQDIIAMIRDDGADSDSAVMAALEDGAYLVSIGITDADIEAVEEAHDMLKEVKA